MKLSILLAGSILTSAMVGNVYAQTCGAQPSCAELGYTLTSTSSCVGNVLKCPFDKTKYYCTQKSEIFSNMALNWNAKVSFSGNSYYYPSKYGFIIASARDTGRGSVKIKVNGITFQSTVQSDTMGVHYVPVKPGDSIYIISYNANEDTFYFVPFAGN